MKPLPILLSLLSLSVGACDPPNAKKEAYDKGFADGQAAALRAAASSQAVHATPTPQVLDPQVRRVFPNSQLQGTALDKKPKR